MSSKLCTSSIWIPDPTTRAPVLFRQQCPVTCNTCTSTSTTSSSTASSTSTITTTKATTTTAATTATTTGTFVASTGGAKATTSGRHACTRIELDPEGKGEGGYKGPAIGYVKHRDSPGGKVWAFEECASACSNPDYAVAAGFKPTSKVCSYFLLSKSRGCVLKTKRRTFLPNDGRGDVTDHADCGATTTPATKAPLTTPPPATKPSPVTTPQSTTKLPATKPPATKPPATTAPARASSTARTSPATTASAATTTTMPARCTAYPHSSNAYAGPIIEMFNDAHPGGYVGDVGRCAALCASNVACTYYSTSTDRGKGCVLKSNRRGKPVTKSAYVGHGACSHEMPATCKLLGTSEGYSRYRTGPWERIKTIRNAAGCAQKCASTPGCTYWLVHNSNGCHLNNKQTGTLVTGKKAFMHHGSCAAPAATAAPTSTPAATPVCPGGAMYNFEPPIPGRQGLAGFLLGSQPAAGSVAAAAACALLCVRNDRCAGFVFGSPTDRSVTAATPACFLYSDDGVRGKLPTAAGVELYLSRRRLANQCRAPPTAPTSAP